MTQSDYSEIKKIPVGDALKRIIIAMHESFGNKYLIKYQIPTSGLHTVLVAQNNFECRGWKEYGVSGTETFSLFDIETNNPVSVENL